VDLYNPKGGTFELMAISKSISKFGHSFTYGVLQAFTIDYQRGEASAMIWFYKDKATFDAGGGPGFKKPFKFKTDNPDTPDFPFGGKDVIDIIGMAEDKIVAHDSSFTKTT